LDVETQKASERGVIRKLSRREVECLAWAAQGKTYQEISTMLGISFGSVKTHLDTARFKLGAVNVTHAVALGIIYGKIFMSEEEMVTREKKTREDAERMIGEMGVIR
jgi:DNA-binding CsgD family transcriptional regulator